MRRTAKKVPVDVLSGFFDATIPPECLIEEMLALRECRAYGGGRIARRHFGMAEEFGARSLSSPAHFVENIDGLDMVGVTAGTSTLKETVVSVKEWLESL